MCGIHLELFDFINGIKLIEINHLDMINCDCNVISDEVAILKF
jgi:hypothetical protein